MCIDKVVDMSQVEPQIIQTTNNGLKWTPKGNVVEVICCVGSTKEFHWSSLVQQSTDI